MLFFLPPLAAAAAAPQTLQPEPNPTALPGAFLAECMPGATPPPLSNASRPFAGDLGEYTFVKFGGEQWRRRLMPEPYVAHVTRETARLLGNASGCVPGGASTTYVADLRSDSEAISRAHRR